MGQRRPLRIGRVRQEFEYQREEYNPESYSDRGPLDFVLSGPVANYRGRGRRFPNIGAAMAWAKDKFPNCTVRPIPEALEEDAIRWALLVKKK
jgi:hypothetical protein